MHAEAEAGEGRPYSVGGFLEFEKQLKQPATPVDYCTVYGGSCALDRAQDTVLLN
jgi:hypothetical protein